MKKSVLSLLALLALSALPVCAQQQTPEQFVSDFTNFVDYISASKHLGAETRQRADSIYNVYTHEYDNEYKTLMTEEQKARYFEARGVYDQYLLKTKGNNAINRADSVGASVGQRVKKSGRNLLHKADSLGNKMLHKIKKGGQEAAVKADTVGNRVGRAVQTGYDQSASYLRGLFNND